MIGTKLKDLRIQKGYTIAQFCELVNLNPNTYAKYERNERDVSTEILTMFADFYEVTTDYLLGREKPKEPTAIDNLVKEFNLSEVEKLMVQAYFLLTPKERQNLVETAERFAEEKEKLADNKSSIRKSTTYTCGELEDMKKSENEDAG